jgi:hypothetical protein
MFNGERWPLVNPQRGIFKPRGMPFLLSIRTVFPRKGGRIWYDDQRQVHRQIFAGEEELDYAFMGTDPSAPENIWLRESAERQIPFIYFLGASPGRYQAIIPTFAVDWDASRLSARIAFGELAGATARRRHRTRSSAATLCAWSNTGCTRHHFGTASLPPTITDVRSATCRMIICWTQPTSWPMPMSCSASLSSLTVSLSRRSTTRRSTTT